MKGFKDHINLIENYIGELLKGLNDNPVYDPVKYFLKIEHIDLYFQQTVF